MTGVPKLDHNLAKIEIQGVAEGFDESLRIEDPQAYLEKNLENIDQIIETMKTQKTELLSQLDKTKKQFVKNFSTNISELNDLISDCKQANQTTKAQLQQQKAADQESNNATAAACNSLSNFNNKPESFEEEEYNTLADDLSKALQVVASNPQTGQLVQGSLAFDQAMITQIRSFSNECAKEAEDGLLISNGGLNLSLIHI